jgi:hypothetical protein
MIVGNNARAVTIDGTPLSPARSQSIVNHSPDGFSWGYGGSGPAQLALALLLEFADDQFARRYYQDFKWDIIAELPDMRHFEMDESVITNWIATKPKVEETV